MTPELISSLIEASATQIPCSICKEVEFIVPLDDEPIDEIYIYNYVCSDCDEK